MSKITIQFENRRIRRVNYTFAISLPKIWMKTMGLKERDIVRLEMGEDGSLIIKPVRIGDKLE